MALSNPNIFTFSFLKILKIKIYVYIYIYIYIYINTRNHKLTLNYLYTSLNIYKSLAQPVLLYDREAWTFKTLDSSRIQARTIKFMRHITDVTEGNIQGSDILNSLYFESTLQHTHAPIQLEKSTLINRIPRQILS